MNINSLIQFQIQTLLQESKVCILIEVPRWELNLLSLLWSAYWCWTKSQEGQKLCVFSQCQGGCSNCPLWGLYLMPQLDCSKCTKTSGSLWSRLASCCPKKNSNKWQQRKEKVTLSLHFFSSNCSASTSAEYFLSWYILFVIFRFRQNP